MSRSMSLPGLSERIEVIEVGTPVTVSGFSNELCGMIFGWDMAIEKSMTNRFPKETPFPNLFLAGAWTFPCGQSAAIRSGLIAAGAVLKLDGR